MLFSLLISFIPFVFLIASPINSCVKVSSEGPMHQRAWDRYLSGYGHASCAPIDAQESRLVLCVHGRTIDYFHRRTECAPVDAQNARLGHVRPWTRILCAYARQIVVRPRTRKIPKCVPGRTTRRETFVCVNPMWIRWSSFRWKSFKRIGTGRHFDGILFWFRN